MTSPEGEAVLEAAPEEAATSQPTAVNEEAETAVPAEPAVEGKSVRRAGTPTFKFCYQNFGLYGPVM